MAATSTDPRVRCVQGSISVGAGTGINLGAIIVPAMPGRILTVVDGWMRAIGGAAATATGVYLEDSSGTVIAVEWLVAALTQNAIARVGATNVTSTNVGSVLTTNDGLKIIKHGADLATATSLDYCIFYTVGI
jgi:hypothetical protein